MEDLRILTDVGTMIVTAAAALLVARRAGIPPILSFLAAGVILGPLTGVSAPSEQVDLFAEVGVALLLFLVGLELSVAKLRRLGGTAALAGMVQVGLTFGAGYGVARLLGYDAGPATVLGLAVAFSSTVVVVKLLDRTGGLDSLPGRLSIGVLLVQDVLVAVALTAFASMAGGGGEEGPSPVASLAVAMGAVAAVGAVGAALVRWVLPRFTEWLDESPEALFVFALAWAFAFILVAEHFHLSVELGAFLAGILLAQLPQSHELWRRTRPVVDFFLAVFFVSLGAQLDLAAVSGNWGHLAAFSVLVLLAKPLVTAVVLGVLGQPRRPSLETGVTLGQVSEFAFILVGLAVAAGTVEASLAGFVGLLGMVTIAASAFLVPRASKISGALERRGLLRLLPGPEGAPDGPAETTAEGEVVVVGMNTLGRILVQELAAMGVPVVAVDTDSRKLAELTARTVQGDLTHPAVEAEAGLPLARLVVSALQIEEVNNLLAWRCRSLGVAVSVHAFDPSLADELLEIGADHLLLPKESGVGLMEARLRSLGVLNA